MKFELDPRTGMYKSAVKRPEDDIHLMSQLPAKSGWIKLLQNRVNMNSVGNIRYAKVMWYDIRTKMLYEERDCEDGEFMRSYILPGAGKPAGWIYVNSKNECMQHISNNIYKSLMENIANVLKEALDDIEFNGKKLTYNPETGKYETFIDNNNNNTPIQVDPDKDVSVKFYHKKISNTVIIDEIQQIIVNMKNADAIEEFFQKQKQQIIDTNGAYTKKFLEIVSELSNKLGVPLTDLKWCDKQACFILYTGYDGFEYKHENEWYIVTKGMKYKYGCKYGYEDKRETAIAAEPLILHGKRTGYIGKVRTPVWYYNVVKDEDVDKVMLMIVNKEKLIFETWVSSIVERIRDARVQYLKDNNLFDTDNVNKIYRKYGVFEKPNNWFEWAKKYIPVYIEANIRFRSMSAWEGGVNNFYKDSKTGKYMINTYMTNDHSDSCGDSFLLSEFLQDKTLQYSKKSGNDPYRCVIYDSDKINMFKRMFEHVQKQIDLGNIN